MGNRVRGLGVDGRVGRRPRELGLDHRIALALALVGGLACGGLTQVAQTYLPDSLAPLANSAAPWVLVAFGLALLCRRAGVAAVAGLLALAGLELGYVIVATARGYPSASTTVGFWLTAAVVFGPLVGLAAYFLRARELPRGPLGGGLVAGIVSGEGLALFMTTRDTTPPGYWIGQMIVGAVLLALVGRRAGPGWAVAGFTVGVVVMLIAEAGPFLG